MSKRFHVNSNEGVSIYEFDPDTLISDQPPNIIVIRARMTVEIAGRIGDEMIKLDADLKPEARFGSRIGALLLHNILSWSGPDFDDLPCTPENIRALPSSESDPFIAKVVEAIAERNAPPKPPAASATSSTSPSAGATESITPTQAITMPLANGQSRSPLLNATIGRRDRSES